MSEKTSRAAQKAAQRAQNKAAWAAGVTLPRWSAGERPSTAGPHKLPLRSPGKNPLAPADEGQPAAMQRAALKQAQRQENQAAWAQGTVLTRWSSGRRPGTTTPGGAAASGSTDAGGPARVRGTSIQERREARAARRAQNKADWAAAQETIRRRRATTRTAAQTAERAERRAADRGRAAVWHEDRRHDAHLTADAHQHPGRELDLELGRELDLVGELDGADRAVWARH